MWNWMARAEYFMIAALVGMKRNIITLFARGGKKIKQAHTPVCFCRFASLIN